MVCTATHSVMTNSADQSINQLNFSGHRKMADEEVLEVLQEVQLQQFFVKIRDQLQITQ